MTKLKTSFLPEADRGFAQKCLNFADLEERRVGTSIEDMDNYEDDFTSDDILDFGSLESSQHIVVQPEEWRKTVNDTEQHGGDARRNRFASENSKPQYLGDLLRENATESIGSGIWFQNRKNDPTYINDGDTLACTSMHSDSETLSLSAANCSTGRSLHLPGRYSENSSGNGSTPLSTKAVRKSFFKTPIDSRAGRDLNKCDGFTTSGEFGEAELALSGFVCSHPSTERLGSNGEYLSSACRGTGEEADLMEQGCGSVNQCSGGVNTEVREESSGRGIVTSKRGMSSSLDLNQVRNLHWTGTSQQPSVNSYKLSNQEKVPTPPKTPTPEIHKDPPLNLPCPRELQTLKQTISDLEQKVAIERLRYKKLYDKFHHNLNCVRSYQARDTLHKQQLSEKDSKLAALEDNLTKAAQEVLSSKLYADMISEQYLLK